MREIRIEGEIGSWTRYDVCHQLRQNKGQPVTIRIASYGGDIAAAIAISHAIADHGDVTVIHDSLNASAATWLPFGAKSIKIHEDCMLYVHCSSMELYMWQQMNAEDLKKLGLELQGDERTLETMDRMIANKYAKRTNGKHTVDDMLKLMQEHPWLTAQQCLEYGFVDEILPEPSGKKVTNSLANRFRNCAIPMPDGVQIERTLLERIWDKVKNFPSQTKEETTANSFSNENNMKKIFLNVMALLLLTDGIKENDDGSVTLTKEQMKSIDDALGEAKTNADKLKNVEKELSDSKTAKTEAENNLKAAVDSIDSLSDELKGIKDVSGKIAKIKEILDKIPVVESPKTKTEEVVDDYADIRKDPINFYEDE